MIVSELITELQALPQDAWCDAMFPDDGSAYAITGVEPLTLSDGRVFCIVNIVDSTPLKAV